jgi:hypothetical protein
MNCANAIRLQASCQAPTLTQFLTNHQKWNDFLLQLSVGVLHLTSRILLMLFVSTARDGYPDALSCPEKAASRGVAAADGLGANLFGDHAQGLVDLAVHRGHQRGDH